nr:hypothetical protein [Tanacetum cinerariifolium]
MASLIFAYTHNKIVFLSKSDASVGFDQIVNFLNAQVIQYALMVNPTIYVSCIKQFWATVSIKKTNDVVKLQALIDKKKVVITEDVIRHDLRLNDADGVECLQNEDIFVELARMGYEKPPLKLTFYKATAWKKFSCSMASAVICLVIDKIAQALDIIKLKKRVKQLKKKRRSKSLGLKRLRKVGTSQRVDSSTKTVMDAQEDASKQRERIEAIDDDEDITLVDMETKVDLGAELQGRKDDDNAADKEVNAAEPTVFDNEEYEDKAEDIDWNNVAEQIQKKHLDNIRKYQNFKRKPVSIAQARKNIIIYLKNMVGYKMEHFKEMSKEDVQNMLQIVPVAEFEVEALHVKYPLIDWEIHYEGSRSY